MNTLIRKIKRGFKVLREEEIRRFFYLIFLRMKLKFELLKIGIKVDTA